MQLGLAQEYAFNETKEIGTRLVQNVRVGMKKIVVVVALFLVFDCFMRHKMNNQIRRYARTEAIKNSGRPNVSSHRF